MTPETDDLQPFLKSTFVIDADHPDIVATARQVTPDAQSDVDQARRLSGGFVSTHGATSQVWMRRSTLDVQPSTTTTRRLPPDDYHQTTTTRRSPPPVRHRVGHSRSRRRRSSMRVLHVFSAGRRQRASLCLPSRRPADRPTPVTP